ncbi:MAG: riboflavin synthase, partial [Nitrospira sp.]|nr:riboflavin synthase [Nitrospira sp.]
MFSGIVEEMGAVTVLRKSLAGARLTILASTVMDDLKIGDSVSVNGICLTVVARSER